MSTQTWIPSKNKVHFFRNNFVLKIATEKLETIQITLAGKQEQTEKKNSRHLDNNIDLKTGDNDHINRDFLLSSINDRALSSD